MSITMKHIYGHEIYAALAGRTLKIVYCRLRALPLSQHILGFQPEADVCFLAQGVATDRSILEFQPEAALKRPHILAQGNVTGPDHATQWQYTLAQGNLLRLGTEQNQKSVLKGQHKYR